MKCINVSMISVDNIDFEKQKACLCYFTINSVCSEGIMQLCSDGIFNNTHLNADNKIHINGIYIIKYKEWAALFKYDVLIFFLLKKHWVMVIKQNRVPVNYFIWRYQIIIEWMQIKGLADFDAHEWSDCQLNIDATRWPLWNIEQ